MKATRLLRDTRGLSTVEHLLVLCLIAVVGLGAWTRLGGTIQSRVEGVDRVLATLEVGEGALGEGGAGGSGGPSGLGGPSVAVASSGLGVSDGISGGRASGSGSATPGAIGAPRIAGAVGGGVEGAGGGGIDDGGLGGGAHDLDVAGATARGARDALLEATLGRSYDEIVRAGGVGAVIRESIASGVSSIASIDPAAVADAALHAASHPGETAAAVGRTVVSVAEGAVDSVASFGAAVRSGDAYEISRSAVSVATYFVPGAAAVGVVRGARAVASVARAGGEGADRVASAALAARRDRDRDGDHDGARGEGADARREPGGLDPAERHRRNAEVRRWYNQQIAQLDELDRQWRAQGVSVDERARRAYAHRHHARRRAREMMPIPEEVQELRQRDQARYGSEDGPTFRWLYDRNQERGLETRPNYEHIGESSRRTNEEYNRRYQLDEPRPESPPPAP
jgi:Flp pilus assembly pilin Flp